LFHSSRSRKWKKVPVTFWHKIICTKHASIFSMGLPFACFAMKLLMSVFFTWGEPRYKIHFTVFCPDTLLLFLSGNFVNGVKKKQRNLNMNFRPHCFFSISK